MDRRGMCHLLGYNSEFDGLSFVFLQRNQDVIRDLNGQIRSYLDTIEV